MKLAIRRVLTSKYFFIPVGALLFYTLMGFVIAPLIVRWYVPRYARDTLQCRAGLSEVRMNPFLLTFEAKGFELTQSNGSPLISFGRLFVDLEMKSLVRWAAVFREFSLENPVVHVIIEPDGGLNLQSLMPQSQEVKEPEKPDSKPFRMLLQNIAVLGGKVAVIDRRQSKPADLVVEMFDLKLKDLSTLQDQNGTYLFTTTTPEGEKFEWQGDITLVPFRSSGKIALTGLRTATLWEFVRDNVNLEPPKGLLNVAAEYHLDASRSPMQCVLEGFRLDLSDLSLKLIDSAQAFLELKKLELDAPSFDLMEKNLQVKKITLDGCAMDIRLDPSGRMNLQQVAREIPPREANEEKTSASEASPRPSLEPAAPAEAESPFKMNADAVEIKGMSVTFDDASPTTPIKGGCSNIDLRFKVSMETRAQNSPTVTADRPAGGSQPPVQLTFEDLVLNLVDAHLKMADAEKALIELKKLDLDATRVDVAEKSVQVAKLLVEGGAVDVRIDSSGRLNLQRVARELGRKHEKEEKTSAPENPPGVSQESGVPAPVEIPFKVNADAVEIKGVAFAFSDLSRASPVKAGCSNIDLSFKADIQAGGKEPEGMLSDISSEVKGLQVSDSQSTEPIFRTGKLTIEGGECNLGARSVVLPRIALSEGHVDVSRDSEGRINWRQLLATKSGAEDTAAPRPSAGSGSSWKYLVKSLELEGFRSRLSDLAARPDKPLFSLQGFKAKLSDLDGKSSLGFVVDFQVEEGGSVHLSGKVDPANPSVEGQVKLTDLSLEPLQPYLEPYVTLVLRSAAVSTQGNLGYSVPGGAANLVYDGSFKLSKLNLTEPDSNQTYLGLGAMQVPKLKLTLQPNGFEAGEIKLSKLVGELIIAEDKTINLTKVLKNQESQDKTPTTSKPKSKEEKEGFPFRIGKVQVEDSNVVFADLSLRPKFNARIHDLKGTVTGLSSAKDARTRIQLDGRVDRFGLARINGAMQLYDFQRSAEIDMVFRNVEMTTLSPYSGKFAGRQIKSGRLSTDLKYRIQNRKLVGDNKIIVDNLVLGEHVDSPDAVNLPLDLAVALLKDSDGRIDIGLPVTGDLDNPEFSIGPLVWKAFVSLLTRAVTAPFRALGSLFGGKGEEFNAVDFDPGSVELLPPEKEKLQKLAGGLLKRPQLKLVLQGRYSPEADGTELKDLNVRRAVAAGLGTELGPEEDPGPLDLTDSKTRKRLEELFEERFGEDALRELDKGIKSGAVKPRTPEVREPDESKRKKKGFFSRMANNLKLYKIVPGGKSPEEAAVWSGELYLRLVESEPLSEEVLVKLADHRAQAVAEELARAGKIPTDRMSIEKSEPLTDEGTPTVKLSLGAL